MFGQLWVQIRSFGKRAGLTVSNACSYDTEMCNTQAGSVDLLGVVREAVERARELRRAGRDPREAGEELRTIRKVCNLLDLEFARVAAEFARSQEYDRDGYVSPVSWIRHECNVTAHAAGSAIRVGDQEPVLTESLAAMKDGEIGFAHLALLAGTAEAVRTASPSGEFDERPLLRLARSHMVNRFRSDYV